MRVVYLNHHVYQFIERFLQQPNEVGGYLSVDPHGNLIPRLTSLGQSQTVTLADNQPILFHTHPGQCISTNSCLLGTPSSTDMAEIARSAGYGVVAHFIFAHEGVYVIQVSLGLKETFGSRRESDIKIAFRQMQDGFVSSGMSYDDYIRHWLDRARRMGFYVQFFPKNKIGAVLPIALR